MIDVFVCTNRVNYTVALHGVLHHPHRDPARRALLFYEPWRLRPLPGPRVSAWPINIWTMRILRTLVALGRVQTMFVPHDALNRRANWSREHVPQVEYLDDGLDTHRRVPQHLALPRVGARRRYHTFRDFADLPAWLEAFDVQRHATLEQMAQSWDRPALSFDGAEHVLVESPGLDVAGVVAGLDLPPDRTLVVRHPVPHKQGLLPADCRVVDGAEGNLEAALLASAGRSFYMGETLALVFAGATPVAQRNRVLSLQRLAEGDAALAGLRWDPEAGPPWRALGLRQLAGA